MFTFAVHLKNLFFDREFPFTAHGINIIAYVLAELIQLFSSYFSYLKMLDWLILFFRIAGLGGNFSAGYDLGELAKIEKEDIANELVRYFSTYELLKVDFCQKISRCLSHCQTMVPNHSPEQKIWISCLLLWAVNSNFLLRTVIWHQNWCNANPD